MSTVTFKGSSVNLINNNFPKAGSKAADINLVNVGLENKTLDDYAGKRKILNIFPSVDTGVCAASVRKFNEKAASLDNTVVLCISADLPFAQNRFCGAEGIENCVMLSTFRNSQFGTDYGVTLANGPLAGLNTRAVIVLDAGNNVIYSELVAEITDEPDYDSALKAL